MKKIIIATVAVALLAVFMAWSFMPKPEGVSKVVLEFWPHKLEVSPGILRDNDPSMLKEVTVSEEDFKELERLVSSADFKDLPDLIKADVPEGSACTESSIIITVTFKDGTTRKVIVDGCAKEPAIVTRIFSKVSSLRQ
jgi:hypothetical protein